ncbi:glycosyltransferase family 4 protein [Echinicola soli]|uniref:Glycosyltransferase family 4 protein n=1 Tax=Echinicola soli TaxID=2591634 RepID=A0A514CN36_9BACT|nr:glycosyltransferase [Echinicola soli]QDH81243.1 glycosyltransferase family 4 protein [Echinicola soli]
MKIIFHLPFEPDKSRHSASQIRPFKMIEAFESNGFEVVVILGTSSTRKKQITEIKQRIIDGEKFDFVYSESSTMPTMLTDSHHLPTYPFLDFSFFAFLKRNQIPIGLFYRDIHWKFEHYKINSFKKVVTNIFYKIDLIFYRFLLDVLFLPSTEMGGYIPELKSLTKISLPPGCDISPIRNIKRSDKKKSVNILYVGGIGDLYNLQMLLTTLCNLKNKRIQFTLCTRETDYDKFKDLYQKYFVYENIHLVHANGQELTKLYEENDICCLFVKPTEYWNFAMPVKLFEYISYKKPILAVKGTAVGNYVEEKGIGWVLDYKPDQLELFFYHILSNNFRDIFHQNVQRTARGNTWKSRAASVANSLINS